MFLLCCCCGALISTCQFGSDLSFTEYEKLSDECSNNLNVLESQFYQLAEAYRKEKLSSLNSQLIQLVEEKSSDYLVPVEELRENRDERIRIAGIVRDYRNKNAKQNYEADLSITEQDFQVSLIECGNVCCNNIYITLYIFFDFE